MSDPSTGGGRNKLLFGACFVALITTAFAFVVRGMLIEEWGFTFDLTHAQRDEIQGTGLWVFAISILLFSLIIDRIGYRKAMLISFICHVASAGLTIFAWDYWSLYTATILVALGCGMVEAVINPIVATMYRGDKTKWLNMLHAGWPVGLILGGIVATQLGDADWRLKIGLLLVPALAYGFMTWRSQFPLQERVAASVSSKEMLGEVGGLGMLVIALLVALELGRWFAWDIRIALGAAVVVAAGVGIYVRGVGRPFYLCLLLLMIPLGITQMGTDGSVTALVKDRFLEMDHNPLWLLVYTGAFMMVLRLLAGPIVHKIGPLGLLMICGLLAAIGLVLLSVLGGSMVFVAVVVFGLGLAFLWPTMLGVVSERFPNGGALTLSAASAVAVLALGVLGQPLKGLVQDAPATARIQKDLPLVYDSIVTEKKGLFGSYAAIDPVEFDAMAGLDRDGVNMIVAESNKASLLYFAGLPFLLSICYFVTLRYFRKRGGYEAEQTGALGAMSAPSLHTMSAPPPRPAPPPPPPAAKPAAPPPPAAPAPAEPAEASPPSLSLQTPQPLPQPVLAPDPNDVDDDDDESSDDEGRPDWMD